MSTARQRLFPPTSTIWRVSRENVLLLGGAAAAILQIAHPQVALGVANHSNFRKDTLGRLHRTLEAVYTITFGTLAETKAMEARVRASHARVQGDKPRQYSAFSNEAQFWVLATLIALSVEIFERVVGPLSLAEKDEYYSEMKIFGTFFGLPENYGPANWTAFTPYYEGMLLDPEMASLPESPVLARHIVYPQSPFILRLGWPISSLIAREFLPSPIRERLGLARSTPHRLVANITFRLLRLSLPLLPTRLRFTPRYLSALKSDATI